MSSKKETVSNTILVALIVCLICGIIVSSAAISLKPFQEVNRTLFRQQNVLQAAGLYQPGMDVREAFESIERRFVDVDTGEYVERPEGYDQRAAAREEASSREVSPDPAGIRRQANVAEVFLARADDGSLQRIILPVHGYGLWSTMYGFLALEADANTIAGIGFYEHGETPGLGGEIDNPRWQQNWEGKQLRKPDGELVFEVSKSPDDGPQYHVDALTGATLTSNGVNNMIRFWTGERGFGPYLERMKENS